MIGIVLYMGAVILTAATPARDPATFANKNIVRIKGACIEVTGDAKYTNYHSIDFGE
jgi:hypothetical protein